MSETTEREDAPVYLAPVITPEVLAKNAEKQAEWQKRITVPDFLLSPEASWQKRDYILQGDLSRAITFLEDELLKIPEKNVEARNRIIVACVRKRDELAEIYARRADFGLAAQIAATPERVELYTEYFKAETRPDTDRCAHNGKNDYFERYPVIRGFVQKLAMVRCGICGFRNLRQPTPAELDKLGYGQNT